MTEGVYNNTVLEFDPKTKERKSVDFVAPVHNNLTIVLNWDWSLVSKPIQSRFIPYEATPASNRNKGDDVRHQGRPDSVNNSAVISDVSIYHQNIDALFCIVKV